jgi:hypothetical protein
MSEKTFMEVGGLSLGFIKNKFKEHSIYNIFLTLNGNNLNIYNVIR